VTTFAAHQIGVLASSGWAVCPSVAHAVENAGLPQVTATYLQETFTADHWRSAQDAVDALPRHFGAARFADEVTYGLLLVPDPARLDTRAAVDPTTRLDQLGTASADVVDPRLPEGRLGVRPGPAWTLIATVTGAYGPALGSHNDITGTPPDRFTVSGLDTRQLMIRQLWGARVLHRASAKSRGAVCLRDDRPVMV